jgi:DNA primase
MRTIDLALPLLVAGQSLRFAMMPAGMDPDDVLKQQGKQAMQDIIDAAIPMVQLLWQRETEGKVFDSPERKAALDKTLREKIKQIVDPSIRSHYGEAIKEMRWDLFRTRKPQQGGKAFTPRKSAAWNPKQQPWERDRAPVASNRSSALGAGIGDQSHMREAVVLATLIATPAVLPKFIAALELMDCSDPNHVQMRNAILRAPDGADLRAALEQELGHDVVASLVGNRMVQITSGLCKPGDTTFAASCLTESFAKLAASRAMPREEEEARYAIDAADESLTWRIRQAKEALDNSDVIASGSSAEMVVAENGATLDSEQLKISRALWESLTIAKPGGDPK